MVDVCRFYLDHQRTRAGGRHRPHLNVVVDLEDLEAGRGGQVVDRPPLGSATLARLLCDCALHRVVMSGRSAIIDYGTSTRTVPAPLWNALVIRDEHCRFPGCDRPSTWCEGHHVVWVTRNGPTDLSNVVLMCTRHHHRLHQPGWHAKLRPDGTLKVTDADGDRPRDLAAARPDAPVARSDTAEPRDPSASARRWNTRPVTSWPPDCYQRATAYLTDPAGRLLVFDHAGNPDAGTQVPAGGIEPGEALERAIVRELMEESGIGGAVLVRKLGETWHLAEPGDVPAGFEEQVHHAFHLRLAGAPVEEAWEWDECSEVGAPLHRFSLRWASLEDAAALLWPIQALWLEPLRRSLRAGS